MLKVESLNKNGYFVRNDNSLTFDTAILQPLIQMFRNLNHAVPPL